MLLARQLPRRARVALLVVVGLLALGAGAAWLPFLHAPLTSDESGYLYLAEHWHPGTSLYGDHWVDRPPLLIALFAIVGHLGRGVAGPVVPAVKLLGAAATTVSVALAATLSGLVAAATAPGRRWPWLCATILSAALLADPLLGMPETDGELLALPLVLLSMTLAVAAHRSRSARRALALLAGAGAAGAAAALVKQNMVDGLVFAAVSVLLTARGTGRFRARLTGLAALAGGAGAALTATLALAAARGTSPAGLWDATVVFRIRAAAEIAGRSPRSTDDRLWHLLRASAASGSALALLGVGALVVAVAARRTPSSGRPLVRAALATVVWDVCSVAGGGSYWLHYLLALVPGLVLTTALAGTVGRRRVALIVVGLVTAYAVGAYAIAWSWRLGDRPSTGADAAVVSYLRAHSAPGDGVVVGFGHADIVAGSGLASPYPDLWSLPVRVHDPRLQRLDALLDSSRAPRWVVVEGESLQTWDVDAALAQPDLERHYVEQRTYGDWHVWRREEEVR